MRVVIVTMFISLAVALLCASVMFASVPRQGYALDVLFGISVAVFLGSFVTVLARRAAAHLGKQDPHDSHK